MAARPFPARRPPPTRRIVVAITGASGALYAQRLIQALLRAESGRIEVLLVVSPLGQRLLHDELGLTGLDLAALAGARTKPPNLTLLPYHDVGAAIASGSFVTAGMVVVPCSNNKLAQIAHGLGDNLISRAAQVCLKERRRLILVHREMPLGYIEIRNMLTLTRAGAIICPANPGFYMRPRSVADLVNTVVARVLDLLEIANNLQPRWTGRIPLAGRTSSRSE